MNDPARFHRTLPWLLACAVLAGCSRGSAAHTVGWYLAHTAERRAMVGRCEDDPGTLGKTPACVNVMAAAAQAGIGSLRGLPPMGLAGGEGTKTGSRTRPAPSGQR